MRARLEASSVKANKKKGFMTPERKKKLRVSHGFGRWTNLFISIKYTIN